MRRWIIEVYYCLLLVSFAGGNGVMGSLLVGVHSIILLLCLWFWEFFSKTIVFSSQSSIHYAH
jgi:hypothetical protein